MAVNGTGKRATECIPGSSKDTVTSILKNTKLSLENIPHLSSNSSKFRIDVVWANCVEVELQRWMK
jgi:hypothetical protein